jgi:hypothetical protein
MIAAPIPPHAVTVPVVKFFGWQGIHPDLIQLNGGDKTTEKIANIFWGYCLGHRHSRER